MGLRRMFPKARIELESQGVDSPKNDWQKFWLNRVMTTADFVSVRDEESAEVVRSFGVKTEVVGDAAENFLHEVMAGKITNFKLQTSNKELVLVNARTEFYGEWPEAGIYLAMEPGDARWCPEGFRGKVIFPDNINEALEVFGSAGKAVGQRLHFLIIAKACGCPEVETLGEPYAEKVEAWLRRQEGK